MANRNSVVPEVGGPHLLVPCCAYPQGRRTASELKQGPRDGEKFFDGHSSSAPSFLTP